MSKKIRVDWEDLKPGDLIHVKGSTNTYKFKSRIDLFCGADSRLFRRGLAALFCNYIEV